MQKMSKNQDIYSNQRTINRYSSGGSSCFKGMQINSPSKGLQSSNSVTISVDKDSMDSAKRLRLKTLMQKKFSYQKMNNSESIEKIDYQKRTDPVLKYKRIKQQWKGLMKTDFSMNQDLMSLNSSIDNVYNMALQRSENKKHNLLSSLTLDKRQSSSPKRKNSTHKKNKVAFHHHILPCNVDHDDDKPKPVIIK